MTEYTVETSKENSSNLTTISLRILTVDDDSDFLKITKRILETLHAFHVDTALSVDEAMRKLKKKSYDAVISDYKMSGKDGLDLLRELRESGSTIPFIMFTGKGRASIAIQALNLGVDQYFNKLGDPETVYGELAHGIRQAVERKRAQEALKKSEEEYHSLFVNMFNGYAYQKIILDEEDKPVDFVYLEVNDGFERLTGLKKESVVGKRITEVIPGRVEAHPELLEIFGRVALTGKSEEFEIEFKRLETWLHVSVYSPRKGYFVTISEDITERKKADNTIRQQNEFLMNTIESLAHPFYVIDVDDYTVQLANTATGFNDRFKGSTCYELTHKSKAVCVGEHVCPLEEVKKTKKPVVVEHIHYGKDGSAKNIEVHGYPIFDDHGNVVQMIEYTIDITERKNAEKVIEHLAKFPSESPNPVLRIAKDGTILYVNNASKSLLQEWKSEVNGSVPKEWFHPVSEVFRSGISQEIEVESDGRVRSFMLTPVVDADYINAYGRDITERKGMEDELRNSEERLRILFESAPDAIYLNDLQGTFVDGNKAAEELTGYPRSELIGKSFMKLKLLPLKQIPKAVKLLTKNFLRKPTGPDEFILNRKDDIQVHVEIRTFPVKIENQNLVLGIARDITERKRGEDERNKLLREYGERVKELNCLYEISKLVEKSDITLEEILRGTVALLPSAWQHPEATCARIMVDEQTFVTDKFRETRWKQTADILVQREKVGVVEVYYLEEMPDFDEGPFLKEERDLIIAVAEQLGRLIQRKQILAERMKAEEALQGANEKWVSLMENTDDVIMVLDGKDIIQDVNSSPLVVNQREVIGMSVYEHIPREQHDTVRKSLQRVFKTGKPDSYEVSPFIQGIGTLWFNTKVVPIKYDEEIVSVILISSNITERRKAEEEIKVKDSAIGSSINAISLADLEGNLTYVNPSFLEMWGFGDDTEVLGRSVASFWQKSEDALKVVKALEIEGCWLGELTARKKDGSPFEVQLSANVVTDDAGKPISMMASFIDITERKKTEAELMKAATYMDAMGDILIVLDMQRKVIKLNKAAIELLGYSSKEVPELTFEKLFPKREHKRHYPEMETALKTGVTSSFETYLLTKDGKEIPVLISGTAMKDDQGKLIGLVGVCKDITERKRTQEELIRLSTAVKMSTDSIMISDLEDKIVYVNDATLKMHDAVNSNYLMGKSSLDFVAPEDIEKAVLSGREVMEKGYLEGQERSIVTRNGRRIPVEVSTSVMKDRDGRTTGFVSIRRDITERNKTLRKLEVMNEKLEVVGGLTRHDVNNKLATVRANIYLAKQGLTSDHKVLEHLSEIESAIGLTTQIFDFARIYEKLGVETLEYVKVANTFEGVCKQFSDLKVAVMNGCGGLRVLADSMLGRLFYNLIDNSLKHGENVTKIRVYYEEANDKLKLVYEDDGVGIHAAEKEKVFEQGYGKGSGLGLYLIRKMCEAYDWTIKETGKQGTGAKFIMTLPKTNVDEGKATYRLQ